MRKWSAEVQSYEVPTSKEGILKALKWVNFLPHFFGGCQRLPKKPGFRPIAKD